MRSDHIVLGILADVDAGKTTLSENILYKTGSIRKAGRVDHGDTCLDTDAMERERGITIFSTQAEFTLQERNCTLLDTPGHADFSAETERVLSVLDYAILLISAPDGIRSHVYTLWKLLKRYGIPTFVFINKTDLASPDVSEIIEELNRKLGNGFMAHDRLFSEDCAMLDDAVTESYLENGTVETDDIRRMIAEGKLMPCYSGSALKSEGIDELLDGIASYTLTKDYSDQPAAKIFKITRDKSDRLSHLKVTGGVLRVKDSFGEEKIEQIRLYSGTGYRPIKEAYPGMIVTVTGLSESYAGQGLGEEKDAELPLLVPLFSMTVLPTFDVSNAELYEKLKQLEEEIPELSVDPFSGKDDVRIRLMGAVQTEVIARIMEERYHMPVRFGSNRIVYRETVDEVSEGVGHFEPLRHYAEVHLLLEPGERGSGMVFDTALSEDQLPGNYQRLILSMLEHRKHRGVLTGSLLTDVKVTLVAGKHHIKHTVGGDFREASCRALRHGLMKNRCRLLEPWYSFEILLPQEYAGRAMSDITCRMAGSFEGPHPEGDMAKLTGRAPVSLIRDYQAELTAYTRGFGKMSLSYCGYFDCHDPETVIREAAYDPDADLRNPCGSVFCEHGAGLYVNWWEVEEHMHLPLLEDAGRKEQKYLESVLQAVGTDVQAVGADMQAYGAERSAEGYSDAAETQSMTGGNRPRQTTAAPAAGGNRPRQTDDKELERIFRASLGRNRKEEEEPPGYGKKEASKRIFSTEHRFVPEPKKNFLLVDGYNIIHAWKELSELAENDLNSARTALLDILANYQGFRGMILIAVFDAYRVSGGKGSIEQYHNIYCVYTKEAETADAYIEKTVHEIGRKHNVTVATSDGLEQIIVFGEGAVRMSAAELYREVQACSTDIAEICSKRSERLKNRIPLEEIPLPGDPKKSEGQDSI